MGEVIPFRQKQPENNSHAARPTADSIIDAYLIEYCGMNPDTEEAKDLKRVLKQMYFNDL